MSGAAILRRGYQYNFSKNSPYVYDRESREPKALTMLTVLDDIPRRCLLRFTERSVLAEAGSLLFPLIRVKGDVVGSEW